MRCLSPTGLDGKLVVKGKAHCLTYKPSKFMQQRAGASKLVFVCRTSSRACRLRKLTQQAFCLICLLSFERKPSIVVVRMVVWIS